MINDIIIFFKYLNLYQEAWYNYCLIPSACVPGEEPALENSFPEKGNMEAISNPLFEAVDESELFNAFVEKVVLHNKLIPEPRFQQVKAYHEKNPDLRLLDILVKAALISPKHATLIENKYEQQQKKQFSEAVSGNGREPEADTYTEKPPAGAAPEKPPGETVPVAAHASPNRSDLNRDAGELLPLLEAARKKNASDLHIVAGSPPAMRIHGRLRVFDREPLTEEETEKLLFAVLNDEERKVLKEKQALDICLDIPRHGRYRSCFTRQRCGWEGAFRVITGSAPDFDSIGLPDGLKRLTEYHHGLVLVTGPTGMGKSTTLAAMVERINQTRGDHIITLEDPVEFVFKPGKAHISQRQIGAHTRSFAAALKAALREDPDVIVIGELRDYETASLAMTAAETGHLVLTTLHTTNVVQTIYRVLDMFPPNQSHQVKIMLSASVRGIVCQRLIPRADGKERILALESMFNIPAVANLIREDKIFQIPNMMRINQNHGMRLLEDNIRELLEKGLIDSNEAYYVMNDQLISQPRDSNPRSGDERGT